ncbi:hypothetical protein [Cryobacterium sp. M15]|uniref:hypothetical protein n=1 Tax=Cryobacterium sp. M15 TaxID=2048291 RepID=UPI001E5CCBE4|nr:hypothetical protein [Cryobacterium sp. M15]
MDITQWRQYRWAAGLLLVQGVLMEGVVFIGALVLIVMQIPQASIVENADIFALPYLQDNLYLMMVMSGVFAGLRICGAVGLLRNRLWGLGLSLVNCIVTLMLMIFLLPAGILDGLLSGTALVLLLFARLGQKRAICPPGIPSTLRKIRRGDAACCASQHVRLTKAA